MFTIGMKSLSNIFRICCFWEFLYADDLCISVESPKKLEQELLAWNLGLAEAYLEPNQKSSFSCENS